mmetsp:Transcript_1037/g.1780  ORF Transcript_1037/g.1780 Transcript_1037/m.1780 type:complete len:323 (+) Transcript_1037:638-1606(+)
MSWSTGNSSLYNKLGTVCAACIVCTMILSSPLTGTTISSAEGTGGAGRGVGVAAAGWDGGGLGVSALDVAAADTPLGPLSMYLMPFSMYLMTSSFSTRPLGPLPTTSTRSMSLSFASLLTAGDVNTLPVLKSDSILASVGAASATFCFVAASGAAAAAGASSVELSPSSSIRHNGFPTWAMSPAATINSTTFPSYGLVISVAALSLWTLSSSSNSSTFVPGSTVHSSTSTSAIPSPMSARRNSFTSPMRLPLPATNPRASFRGPSFGLIPLLRVSDREMLEVRYVLSTRGRSRLVRRQRVREVGRNMARRGVAAWLRRVDFG